jgi:hypothetical protein
MWCNSPDRHLQANKYHISKVSKADKEHSSHLISNGIHHKNRPVSDTPIKSSHSPSGGSRVGTNALFGKLQNNDHFGLWTSNDSNNSELYASPNDDCELPCDPAWLSYDPSIFDGCMWCNSPETGYWWLSAGSDVFGTKSASPVSSSGFYGSETMGSGQPYNNQYPISDEKHDGTSKTKGFNGNILRCPKSEMIVVL